jgi:hypothetical protein
VGTFFLSFSCFSQGSSLNADTPLVCHFLILLSMQSEYRNYSIPPIASLVQNPPCSRRRDPSTLSYFQSQIALPHWQAEQEHSEILNTGTSINGPRLVDELSRAELTLILCIIPAGISSFKTGVGGKSINGGDEARESDGEKPSDSGVTETRGSIGLSRGVGPVLLVFCCRI